MWLLPLFFFFSFLVYPLKAVAVCGSLVQTKSFHIRDKHKQYRCTSEPHWICLIFLQSQPATLSFSKSLVGCQTLRALPLCAVTQLSWRHGKDPPLHHLGRGRLGRLRSRVPLFAAWSLRPPSLLIAGVSRPLLTRNAEPVRPLPAVIYFLSICHS